MAEPIYLRTCLATYPCCRNCGHVAGNHAATRCFQKIGAPVDAIVCDCTKWEA